ncbi:Hsp20 family protein [Halostella sp. JP-L12]|uniref:Hsp20/alpha crystallin family protein n=1 Tax=Halostella TaxID=1843185 RepID=UPI000EF7C1E9|nr:MULTISPECIES: Hsp20/alpha crystallin family protein [Halostella]NHN47465.1 Hsp20 family protein [Halostella sp. JP-L12]
MTLREIGKSVSDTVLKQVGRAASRLQESKSLSTDVLESDDAYLVVFDAPGAESSDVQVRFVDDDVLVRIDRFRDYHEGYEMRFPGRGLALEGSAELPDDAAVDAEAAKATLTESGELRVRLPKIGPDESGGATDDGDATISA